MGFTLVELVIVVAIIGVLSATLLFNFRSTQTGASARAQVANVLISDIRDMQSRALSGSNPSGVLVCGYGIHYINATTYVLFARPVSGGTPCAADARPKTYQVGDLVLAEKNLLNPQMVFANAFADVYYEIPSAKGYINNNSLPSQFSSFLIAFSASPGVVTTVHVSASGNVTVLP